MAKSLKDILDGVKKSKIVPGSTGKDPGVDYAPKAKSEQEFVALHKTEKHADRVGNGDDVYQATNIKHSQIKDVKHGYKKPEDQKVNEASSCNMTEEGTYCPVHEMSSCGSSKKKSLKEVITKHSNRGIQNEDLAVPLLGSKDDDESAEMAKTQLRAIANKAMHLAMQLSDNQVVEPWVQAKIAVAKDNVSAVHDYMIFGNHDKPEDEQTAPYVGGIDMSGAPRNTYPNFSADVNTGRNV